MKEDIEVSRMILVENRGSIRAFCSIRIGGAIDINDVKVIEGEGGTWVGMPQVTGSDGHRRAVVWINDGALKQAIEDAVLAKWRLRGAKNPPPTRRERAEKSLRRTLQGDYSF